MYSSGLALTPNHFVSLLEMMNCSWYVGAVPFALSLIVSTIAVVKFGGKAGDLIGPAILEIKGIQLLGGCDDEAVT